MGINFDEESLYLVCGGKQIPKLTYTLPLGARYSISNKELKPGHIGIENMVEAILVLQKRHGYDKGIRMWLRDNAKPDKVYCPVISLEEDDEQYGGF